MANPTAVLMLLLDLVVVRTDPKHTDPTTLSQETMDPQLASKNTNSESNQFLTNSAQVAVVHSKVERLQGE